MDIEKVGVVGCGLMGSGIAEVAAKAGFDVVVREVSDNLIEDGRGRIRKSLDRAVKRGKLTAADREAAWSRLRFSTELSDLADRHLVIEAIVERADVKLPVLKQLDAGLPPSAILASNTSTIPISQLASELEHPERFCGIHFFNPVRSMKLVEVIRGDQTSDQTVVTAVAHVKRLGK